MKKILLFSFMLLSALVTESWAQERTISGKVTSVEDGSTLPGVNVVLKGTTNGTITDVDGNYKLSVPSEGGTLTFSFVGLTTEEVEIGARSVIDLTMTADVQQLSEVVVTAIGIQREKKALGYAVSNVGADKIAQKSEPDAVRALQGKVPGVNINAMGGSAGGGTRITIRGNSSLLGNNQPLFVVDGIPFDNQANEAGNFTSATGASATSRSFDIDPNNIESMTVLKGAAASALYGSRASNGVIVITTKSGSSSASKKGLEITARTSYSVENVNNLPDYQTQYTQGNNFKYVDGNFGTWGAPFDLSSPAWDAAPNADKILSIDPSTGLGWVNHPYDRYNNPNTSPYFPEFDGDSILLQSYNTPKDFFRTGSVFETSFSIAAGGEKSNFSVGMTRTVNEGIIPENKVERISANVGGNATLDNGLFVGASFNYVRTDLTTPPNGGFYAGAISIMDRLLYTPPNVNAAGLPFEDAQGNHAWYRPDNDNPYYLAKYAPHTSLVNRYYGNLTLGYDVFEWLNVSYKIGTNVYTDSKRNILPPTIQNGTELGTVVSDDLTRSEVDGNFIITVSKDLSEDLGLVARVGHNFNYRKRDRQAFQATTQIVNGVENINNYQTLLPLSRSGINERSYHAYYADISFDFKNYLFLNMQGRNDITSTLPKESRSYFYGGVSSSLIFTDAFGIANDILSFGKLRASIARTGSDPSAYLTSPTTYSTNPETGDFFNGTVFPYTRGSFAPVNGQTIDNTLGNADLTPEFTTEWEVGTEMRFLNNRFGFDFTYYDRTTTDQIVSIDVASSSGYTSKVVNLGELSNKGIEVALDANVLKLGDFRWDLFFVFDRNRNIVESLGEGLDKVIVGGFSNGQRIVHVVGEPFGQIESTLAARHTDGQLLIDPLTGKLFDGEEGLIGNPNPDYKFAVTNTFSWKGISLNVLVDYTHGGQIWSGTYNQVYGRGLTTGTVPDGPRGREITVVIPGLLGDPNTGTALVDDAGSTIQNGTMLTVNDWYFINTFGSAGYDEFSVFDASTVRLREISLGYDLPSSLLEKSPFGSASITFTGRNLWFKALNFPGDLNFDPEAVGLGANSNALGLDFGMTPNTKRFGVNVKLTF